MLLVHLNRDNHIQYVILGGILSEIRSEIMFYGSADDKFFTSPNVNSV